MLFQSLNVCKTTSKIIDLVNDQPYPVVFYNAYLELDGANMASILSFDSRSMSYLLSDDFDDYFTEEYPIFYKNKIVKGQGSSNKMMNMLSSEGTDSLSEHKYFYRSAIDNALRNN